MSFATPNEPGAGSETRRGGGPVVTLVLLSPVIAELPSGSIHLTTIFALPPTIGVWGCGALLIREVVRRRGGGWLQILMLGLALAVAEECIIQQTSLAPLVGIPADRVYGRAFGVNWIYLLWALGFESVWAVLLPISLTEFLFPARRTARWLGRRGILVAGLVCAAASFLAWFMWTQVFLPRMYPDSVYHVPPAHTLAALVVIAALICLALIRRRPRPPHPAFSFSCPAPWLCGMCAFSFSLPWYLQILLAFGAARHVPSVLAFAGGCLAAVLALLLSIWWSGQPAWSDRHRYAASMGVIVATMVGGAVQLTVAGAPLVDRIAQLLFSAATLAFIAHLARRKHALQRSAQ